MRLLVCGGRAWNDRAATFGILDRVHAKWQITTLIHGGASGADSLAGLWATENSVPVVVFCAQWSKYGRKAGPMRNAEMLVDGKPDGVLAFPGRDGTANMVTQATAAGVTVWQPFGTEKAPE